MFQCSRYDEGHVVLDRDDVLVAYTDGVAERVNSSQEEWGTERIRRVIESCGSRTAEEMIREIFASVDCFACGPPQDDDMTLLALRVL